MADPADARGPWESEDVLMRVADQEAVPGWLEARCAALGAAAQPEAEPGRWLIGHLLDVRHPSKAAQRLVCMQLMHFRVEPSDATLGAAEWHGRNLDRGGPCALQPFVRQLGHAALRALVSAQLCALPPDELPDVRSSRVHATRRTDVFSDEAPMRRAAEIVAQVMRGGEVLEQIARPIARGGGARARGLELEATLDGRAARTRGRWPPPLRSAGCCGRCGRPLPPLRTRGHARGRRPG